MFLKNGLVQPPTCILLTEVIYLYLVVVSCIFDFHPYLGNDPISLIFFQMGWFKPPTQYMLFPSFLVELNLSSPSSSSPADFEASQPGWGQAVGIDVLPMQDGFDKGKMRENTHGSLLVVEA